MLQDAEWMQIVAEGFMVMVRKLAAAWKTLLKKSNAELGIDEEFTRPGLEALLEDFAKEVLAS